MFASNCNHSVAEAIQSCCGGYIVMLRRLYSYVAEAIQLCCGGYTCFFTDNNTTPTKVVLSFFGLLVGLWQLTFLFTISITIFLFILCKNQNIQTTGYLVSAMMKQFPEPYNVSLMFLQPQFVIKQAVRKWAIVIQ